MELRRMWLTGVAFASVVLLVLMLSAPAVRGQADSGESEVQRGFQINPVPLNLHGKNLSLVGLGAFLVNGPQNCAECHTSNLFLPGGNPFNGEPTIINTARFMGGGRPFGPVLSRNLTPDSQGLPGGLTFEQFDYTMRTGVDLKGLHPAVALLQVMPWPAYRHDTGRNMRALYEYLSAIPCVEGGLGVPPNRCR
jgi:hypothetical protein